MYLQEFAWIGSKYQCLLTVGISYDQDVYIIEVENSQGVREDNFGDLVIGYVKSWLSDVELDDDEEIQIPDYQEESYLPYEVKKR
jgi:hypothetical protein